MAMSCTDVDASNTVRTCSLGISCSLAAARLPLLACLPCCQRLLCCWQAFTALAELYAFSVGLKVPPASDNEPSVYALFFPESVAASLTEFTLTSLANPVMMAEGVEHDSEEASDDAVDTGADVWMFECLDAWMLGCLDTWMLGSSLIALSSLIEQALIALPTAAAV